MKLPITERALVARMNRKLEMMNKMLRKHKPDSRLSETGRFYIVDLKQGQIERQGSDLESWAREIGCLKDYEQLEGI